MNLSQNLGLYLCQKQKQDQVVLKEMLQLLKTLSRDKGNSFSYIEAGSSLHPHLTLWENLQVETGPTSWKEFSGVLSHDFHSLTNLLKDHGKLTKDAEPWEKFLIGLIKGIVAPSHHMLIDINENDFSPFLIQSFKKSIVKISEKKNVFLASAHSSVWIDCAHTLVHRNGYKFDLEKLDADQIKKHWIA